VSDHERNAPTRICTPTRGPITMAGAQARRGELDGAEERDLGGRDAAR
jgi:hypothetical protein